MHPKLFKLLVNQQVHVDKSLIEVLNPDPQLYQNWTLAYHLQLEFPEIYSGLIENLVAELSSWKTWAQNVQNQKVLEMPGKMDKQLSWF